MLIFDLVIRRISVIIFSWKYKFYKNFLYRRIHCKYHSQSIFLLLLFCTLTESLFQFLHKYHIASHFMTLSISHSLKSFFSRRFQQVVHFLKELGIENSTFFFCARFYVSFPEYKCKVGNSKCSAIFEHSHLMNYASALAFEKIRS